MFPTVGMNFPLVRSSFLLEISVRSFVLAEFSDSSVQHDDFTTIGQRVSNSY